MSETPIDFWRRGATIGNGKRLSWKAWRIGFHLPFATLYLEK